MRTKHHEGSQTGRIPPLTMCFLWTPRIQASRLHGAILMPRPSLPPAAVNRFMHDQATGARPGHIELVQRTFRSSGRRPVSDPGPVVTERAQARDLGPGFNGPYHGLGPHGDSRNADSQSRDPFDDPRVADVPDSFFEWVWTGCSKLSGLARAQMPLGRTELGIKDRALTRSAQKMLQKLSIAACAGGSACFLAKSTLPGG